MSESSERIQSQERVKRWQGDNVKFYEKMGHVLVFLGQGFTYLPVSMETRFGVCTELEINNTYGSVRYCVDGKYYFEHEMEAK